MPPINHADLVKLWRRENPEADMPSRAMLAQWYYAWERANPEPQQLSPYPIVREPDSMLVDLIKRHAESRENVTRALELISSSPVEWLSAPSPRQSPLTMSIAARSAELFRAIMQRRPNVARMDGTNMTPLQHVEFTQLTLTPNDTLMRFMQRALRVRLLAMAGERDDEATLDWNQMLQMK